jgi:hypothetical protein
MTFNFIDPDVESEEEDEIPTVFQPGGHQQVIDEVIAESDEVDQLMGEAERRFEKAQYYQSLLRQPFFDDLTQTSEEVMDEIRGFIRERLSILLGITPEAQKSKQVVSDFAPDELKVLKQVAARILKKPELGEISPQVRVAAPPVKVAVRPTQPQKVQARPQPKQPAKVAPKPATPPAKPTAAPKKTTKSQSEPEFVTIEGEFTDSMGRKGITSNTYQRFKRKGGDVYVDQKTGTHHRMDDNGQMRNITRQTRPLPGARQPLPPLNALSMANVAAQHYAASERAVERTALGQGTNTSTVTGSGAIVQG